MRVRFAYPLAAEQAENDSLAGSLRVETPICLDDSDDPVVTVHDLARLLLSTADAPITYTLGEGEPTDELATCGHCGRTWDDGISSTWTPTPSGRCPFEYLHVSPPEARHSLYMGEDLHPGEDAWDRGLTTDVLIDRVTQSLRQEGEGDELVILIRTYERS